jgi:hypothetical protein
VASGRAMCLSIRAIFMLFLLILLPAASQSLFYAARISQDAASVPSALFSILTRRGEVLSDRVGIAQLAAGEAKRTTLPLAVSSVPLSSLGK